MGWLPEDNDDSDSDNIGDLWHMVHDDGDEEDLENRRAAIFAQADDTVRAVKEVLIDALA